MNLFKALNDKEDGLFNIFPFLFQDDSCGEEFTKEAEDFLLDVMFIDDSIMISILSRPGVLVDFLQCQIYLFENLFVVYVQHIICNIFYDCVQIHFKLNTFIAWP